MRPGTKTIAQSEKLTHRSAPGDSPPSSGNGTEIHIDPAGISTHNDSNTATRLVTCLIPEKGVFIPTGSGGNGVLGMGPYLPPTRPQAGNARRTTVFVPAAITPPGVPGCRQRRNKPGPVVPRNCRSINSGIIPKPRRQLEGQTYLCASSTRDLATGVSQKVRSGVIKTQRHPRHTTRSCVCFRPAGSTVVRQYTTRSIGGGRGTSGGSGARFPGFEPRN